MANEYKLSFTAEEIDAKLQDSASISYVDESQQILSISTKLAMPGSLKWDGVIGDRKYVTISEEGCLIAFVHVSDEYPQVIKNYIDPDDTNPQYAVDGAVGISEGPLLFSMPTLTLRPDGLCVGGEGMVAIIPEDNYITDDGIVFPKKGIYFIAYSMLPYGHDASLLYANALSIMGHSFADTSSSEGNISRYFETKTVTTFCGDTISFNENFNFIDRVLILSDDETELYALKVSNQIIELSDVEKGIVYALNDDSGNFETVIISGEEATDMFQNNVYALGNGAIIFAPYDNFNLDGILIPTAGIWTVAVSSPIGVWYTARSLTIPGYNFNISINNTVIKTEHLPEALRFGGDEVTYTLNPDTMLIVGYLSKLSDATPSLDELYRGFTIEIGNMQNENEQVTFTKTYITKEKLDTKTPIFFSVEDGAIMVYVGDGNDSTAFNIPIMTIIYKSILQGDEIITTGIYACDLRGLQLPIWLQSVTLHDIVKIDPKYLPEGLNCLPEVTEEDEGAVLKVVNGKWAVVKGG